jgi:hypothetical protein
MQLKLSLVSSLVLLLMGAVICSPVTASIDELAYALKPSPAVGPYDDTLFMTSATEQITGLSGKVIPYDGPELLNLKSSQIQLSRMNISADFHSNATQINEYLFKIVSAGETYGTTKTLTDHPNTLGNPEYDPYTKARATYTDAMMVWSNISPMFPNATPPKLPDPELPILNE